MSWLFESGGQSIGASASVLPMNYSWLISFRMDWFDLLAVQGTLKVFSNTIVQKHQFSSVSKEPACKAGVLVSISGLTRSPGEGNGSLLQYSSLENPVDRDTWQAAVHEVTRVGRDLATEPPLPPAFLMVQLSHPYMATGKTIDLTRRTFVSKVMSLLFNTLSRSVIL